MTSADALRRAGAAVLAAAGVESAAHDAAELLAHVLDVEPGRLLLVDDVDGAARERYDAALDRRAAREPLQHITGHAYFAGLDLAVGPGVFVPRPETELIVAWAVGVAAGRAVRVADLCSGSGALALGVARHAPTAHVTAVERSPEAFEYLTRNIAATGRGVHAVLADVTDAAAMARELGACDVIVSNPPYVPAASPVSPEVAHDPYDAVFSGEDGMDVIGAMIPIVADALVGGGAFAVEHDDETSDAVVTALRADGRFDRVEPHTDLAGRPRFVTAFRRGEPGVVADRARMER
ncbi:release factor glutamine methyltransferase [Gordonia spumicola]|uniref:Release factor glutamine methyltransferase n=1 Tax=Gordonia spumicola TaxID=589161 RepID=A0A7I9V9U9_9ACTN|nr:peptide chain release factor N(5)-glutamine methyltransferase [Gordonia spumicola]GEE02117.1 release factor glutamine methyltransferase [Gordonia spumicola]